MPLRESTVLQEAQILDEVKRTGVKLTSQDIAQIADALAENRVRRLVLDACGLTANPC